MGRAHGSLMLERQKKYIFKGGDPMLRCNLAGLIPLMASERYREQTEGLYERFKPAFEAVMRTRSCYQIGRAHD